MERRPKTPTTKGPAGASADSFMCHLAMWEDDDASWGEHVTDEEYRAAPLG